MNVSVIIPAYNCGPFISETLESVLKQTAPPSEVIVVDDGSTDDTAERVAAFGGRVRYIRQSNARVAAARNRGIKESAGDLLAFLDGDDVWHPAKLEFQVAALRQHSDIGGLGARMIDWPGEAFPPMSALGQPDLIRVPIERMLVRNYLATSTMIVRRDVIEKVGLFDTNLNGPEDYDMWIRIGLAAGLAKLDLPLTGYRNVVGSIGKQGDSMYDGLNRLLQKLDSAGVWRGRSLLRRKAYSQLDMSCSYLFSAAGRPRKALFHGLRSVWRYPLPFRRDEVHCRCARIRMVLRTSLGLILTWPSTGSKVPRSHELNVPEIKKPPQVQVRQRRVADRPLTVLHILDYEPTGNRTMDEFLLQYVDGIRARGWRPLFVFAGEPWSRFKDELQKRGASYQVAGFPLSWRMTFRLASLLGRNRPSVLVSSFLSPFNKKLLLLKLLGVTRGLVIIDHSSGRASVKTGLRRILAKIRGRIAGRIIDRVLPVSDAIARRDAEDVFLPRRKIRRIYNGVALERFTPANSRPGGQLRIAYAGQLIPEKGVITLLDAFRNLPPDIQLTIAGKGDQEKELRDFCRRHDLSGVRFIGQTAAVGELFSSSDIVVVPSLWAEAFGLVAAEALACGTAVIVSDAGALPEVVGDAGLVFQHGHVADLEHNLRRLIDSPRLRSDLGNRARERAVSMFSMTKCISDHLAELDDLATNRR